MVVQLSGDLSCGNVAWTVQFVAVVACRGASNVVTENAGGEIAVHLSDEERCP